MKTSVEKVTELSARRDAEGLCMLEQGKHTDWAVVLRRNPTLLRLLLVGVASAAASAAAAAAAAAAASAGPYGDGCVGST